MFPRLTTTIHNYPRRRGAIVLLSTYLQAAFILNPDSSSRSSQAAKQPTIQRRAFIDKRYLGQLRTVLFFNGKKQLLRAASKYKKVSYIRGLAWIFVWILSQTFWFAPWYYYVEVSPLVLIFNEAQNNYNDDLPLSQLLRLNLFTKLSLVSSFLFNAV